ncbi:magnesium transporter [bacterium]|jgi:magnesium transporter|nr:magnesium transporter [bacterium]
MEITRDTTQGEPLDHITDLIRRLVDRGTEQQYYLFFLKYHEADIAEALADVTPDERARFFSKVKLESGADVFEEMEPSFQLQLVESLKTELVAKYVGEMDPDDAADLMEDLREEDEELADEILEALPESEAADIQELLSYNEDSAGALMTSEYLWIPEDLTVSGAIDSYRSQAPPDSELSFYVYIVDGNGTLVGVTSIRNLLLAEPDEPIKDVRNDSPIKVHQDVDQEKVAKMFRKYDLVVLPVVDDWDQLLGIITIDDVVDVVVEEATEDMYRLSGTGTSDFEEGKLLHGKSIYAVWSRLPWLLVTILGGLVASYVMVFYSNHFPQGFVPLAVSLSFVPLLMGLGGNVGNQSATIIVRGLATGGLRDNDVMRILLRELVVGGLIGVLVGLVVFLITSFFGYHWQFAMIVAVSVVMNIIVAAIIGATLPIVFRKMNIDPAVASAPFISTTLDIIGQIIYFGLTILLLHYVIS